MRCGRTLPVSSHLLAVVALKVSDEELDDNAPASRSHSTEGHADSQWKEVTRHRKEGDTSNFSMATVERTVMLRGDRGGQKQAASAANGRQSPSSCRHTKLVLPTLHPPSALARCSTLLLPRFNDSGHREVSWHSEICAMKVGIGVGVQCRRLASPLQQNAG